MGFLTVPRIALVVVALGLSDCTGVSVGSLCQCICRELDECGYLPSPLGSGRENCEQRCALSATDPNSSEAMPGSVRDRVATCFGSCQNPASTGQNLAAANEADAAFDTRVQSQNPLIARCQDPAACLNDGSFGIDIIGTSTLNIVPEVEPAASEDPSEACPGDTSDRPVVFSKILLMPSLPSSVFVDGKALSADCNPGFRGFSDVVVPAGVYQTSLKALYSIQAVEEPTDAGSLDVRSGDAGVQTADASVPLVASVAAPARVGCYIVKGEPVIASAGLLQRVAVVLPAPDTMSATSPCESSCADRDDEDKDGFMDCDDINCAEFCSLCPFIGVERVPDCTVPGCAPFCPSLDAGMTAAVSQGLSDGGTSSPGTGNPGSPGGPDASVAESVAPVDAGSDASL